MRFIAVIEGPLLRRSLSLVCDAAKKYRLSLQHFFTTSSSTTLSIASGNLPVNAGDTVVEIVGLYAQGCSSFQREALSGIHGATIAPITAIEMNVRPGCFLLLIINNNLLCQYIQDALRTLSGIRINQPTTLCLVKPHILKAYRTGELLQAINEAGFDIFALFSVHLTIPMAEELFDAYRGVVSDYSAMIDAMASSPVLALAVTIRGCDDEFEIVERFREFCGPTNPALAKVLRPNSLRARFGESALLNAIHCTDLPEDGEMECRYFFESLANL